MVAPDSGFAKEARRFARYLKLPVAIGDKEREDHSENAKIIEIVGEVQGKNALIVDDFSISGGTLVDLANELKRRGAKKIIASLSHILLNEKKGVNKLEGSPIEMLISTDSVNNPYVECCDKVKLISVAPLFAETIRRIHNRESVSPLFNKVPIEVLDSGEKY